METTSLFIYKDFLTIMMMRKRAACLKIRGKDVNLGKLCQSGRDVSRSRKSLTDNKKQLFIKRSKCICLKKLINS
jgi:hypothetical protein